MEVHHHPHVEKKSFNEYLLEGLMIFLAVTMGFFAENIREHFVDKEREHEYMHSLYQDLKTDIGSLDSAIKDNEDDIAMYDSIFTIFKTKRYVKETVNLYYYTRTTIGVRSFYPTDGTLKQLENAGGFRLIKNRGVIDSLQSYKQGISLLKDVQEYEHQYFMSAKNQLGKIFDADVFDSVVGNKNDGVYKRPDKNYPLMPFTNTDLNEFHVPMNLIKGNRFKQIRVMILLKRKATNLIKLLNEKYHLENE